MDGGDSHWRLHDGKSVALTRGMLEGDGVANCDAEVVGGLAGQHEAGAVLGESSLLEGGRPQVALQVDGFKRHVDGLMARCRQRATETEHGLHGTHRIRCGQRGQLGAAFGDEAVERGRDPVGMLAEQLGLVAVHGDVERVEQAEDDHERRDRGADAKGGQHGAARGTQDVAERHAAKGAHRPAQAP